MSLVRALRLLAFASATALAALVSSPGYAFDACAAAREIAGPWRFTTLVTQAKAKGGLGVNGFYDVTFTLEDGCRLRADFVKSGYAKIKYAADQRPTGSAVVTADSVPPQEEGGADMPADYSGDRLVKLEVTMKAGDSEIPMAFELIVSGKQLFGRWWYLGAAWDSAGMGGSLKGARGAGGHVSFSKHRQIACDMQCELDGFYVESNSLNECRSSCSDEHKDVGAGRRSEAADEGR